MGGEQTPMETVQPLESNAPAALPRAPLARLGYVDGLRALAALAVMVSHMLLEVWPAGLPGVGATALLSPIFFGHAAVSVFIALSGFSLMLPVARNANRLPWGVWGFYWRRARRILPPYYLSLALSLLLIWLLIGAKTGTHWDNALPVTAQVVVEHLLLLQDVSRTNPAAINIVYWSIAVECQIYLLFPALVLLWRRYHPVFALCVAGAGAALLTLALTPTWIGQTPGYLISSIAPHYIGIFAMGMFAASLAVNPSPRWARLRARFFWEAIALGAAALVVIGAGKVGIALLDPLVGAATVGLLLAATRPAAGWRNPIRAILEWRPLVWIGGFSYSLYLIHAPLVQVVWQYALHPLGLGATATYLLLLLAGGPLIILVAWGFWYVCERPFLNSRIPGARTGGARESHPSAAV